MVMRSERCTSSSPPIQLAYAKEGCVWTVLLLHVNVTNSIVCRCWYMPNLMACKKCPCCLMVNCEAIRPSIAAKEALTCPHSHSVLLRSKLDTDAAFRLVSAGNHQMTRQTHWVTLLLQQGLLAPCDPSYHLDHMCHGHANPETKS